MIWTDKKPDRIGYWWWREAPGKEALIEWVDVYIDDLEAVLGGPLATMRGQWSSEPVPEPTEREADNAEQ
jgi:hypothetical protein